MSAPDGAVHGGDAVGLRPVRRSFFHAEREGGGQMLIVQKAAFGAVRGCFRAFCADLCVRWPVGGLRVWRRLRREATKGEMRSNV